MAKKAQKPKELPPHDRRPWPKKGDRSIDKLYAGVGRALSQWEVFEGTLSLLFSYFVLSETPEIARRAYNAVRTFEGRADMLKAASEAYFTLYPDATLQSDFVALYKSAKSFGPRRNDIAHGVVVHFLPEQMTDNWRPSKSYGLIPSYANFKDRDVTGKPAYCYTTKELDYFRVQFSLLTKPAILLGGTLVQLTVARANASRNRQIERYRASTNQAVAQTNPQ